MHREQSDKGMVDMDRSDWCDLRLESSNDNEAPDIPNSGSTDIALRLRNMANMSIKYETRMATTDMRMV